MAMNIYASAVLCLAIKLSAQLIQHTTDTHRSPSGSNGGNHLRVFGSFGKLFLLLLLLLSFFSLEYTVELAAASSASFRAR
jgi:hypothetical protein